ncbi:PREDICTED: uncharacterized protein LOC104586374 isoform X2 [Nelumbo nucifera]|uniref:Protein TRM32-like n=2 Tax=Nelumbo nucifera TaxID=4432 RepID=A0A822ZQ42_NELNU|nr:PREDICTED: uncharacterized protein LOC104586374 isoform X2 [Nelumbo nucifera]DAD47352.1 TPA_asm: hypothetical protein HUJ06_017289 [Nelumbo nucifera]
MAKRSQKRRPRREKDQLGCIWGLISIFDFRQGHFTLKLLSDRRRGSRNASDAGYSRNKLNLLNVPDKKCGDTDDVDKSKIHEVDSDMKSVKKHMEEQMSYEKHQNKQITSASLEQIQCDLGGKGHKGKNHKQRNSSCNNDCDVNNTHELKASTSLEHQQPFHPDSVEESLNNINLAALMEEFFSQIHQHLEIPLRHDSERDPFDVQRNTQCETCNQLDGINMLLIQQHSILQEKLNEATKRFLSQKSINVKQLTGDREIHQFNQFIDAIEILNTNKELFLKLLQNPNSLFTKYVQELQDSQAEKVEQTELLAEEKLSEEEISNSSRREELIHGKNIQKQKMHNFFRRKKSRVKDPSVESESPQASSKIVILKPTTAVRYSETHCGYSPQSHYSLRNEELSMELTSHFSLREIKRRLKHAMGERKEGDGTPMVAMRHTIPYKNQHSSSGGKETTTEMFGKGLPSSSHFHVEKFMKPSTNVKKGKPKDHELRNGHKNVSSGIGSYENLNMATAEYCKERESNIYSEAKKHLVDMFITEDEDEYLSSRPVTKKLGRILSLPEYNLSPIFSPARDGENSSVNAQMRSSHYDNVRDGICLSPLKKNIETPPCPDNSKPDSQMNVSNLNLNVSEEIESTCTVKEVPSPKGNLVIVEVADTLSAESNVLDEPSELSSNNPNSRTNQRTDTTKINEEEVSSEWSRPESPKENQSSTPPLSSPLSSSLLIEKVDLEGIDKRVEQPSPVSVLDPLLEDIISPASIPSQFEINSRSCMENKRSIFKYVSAVLEASGLSSSGEFLRGCHSSDYILEPSLFDEVEVITSQLCGDRKLLFDCINEILVEMYQCYFSCTPWVSFVKPNTRPVPVGKHIIDEVWEGMDWHIQPQLPQQTLDQIVGKDMAKSGAWMDLKLDTENIGSEMGEAILEDLMEETISELWT